MKIEYVFVKSLDEYCTSKEQFCNFLCSNKRIRFKKMGEEISEKRMLLLDEYELEYRLEHILVEKSQECGFHLLIEIAENGDEQADILELFDRIVREINKKNGNQFSINTIWNDASAYYGKKLYPEIIKIEGMLRKIIYLFMLKTVGSKWFSESTPEKFKISIESVIEKNNKPINEINSDWLTYADFITLIYFFTAPYSLKSNIKELFEELELYVTEDKLQNKNQNNDKKVLTAEIVNKLSDEFKNATKTDINDLLPRIKSLVASAKSYKDNQVKPTMVLKTNGETLTLSKDNKYYESPLMTATLTGASTYKAEVSGAPKGTTVVNEKGEAKSSFNSNEKVKVQIPVSAVKEKTNLTVKFTASGKVQKAMIYKTTNSEYQRVAGLYDEVVSLEQSTKLTVTPKARVCEIDGDKYYGINGTEVDKATYDKECNKHVCEIVDDEYYGANGTIVDKATFDSECGNEVIVPNTSSNVSTLAIVMGLLMIVSGSGLIAYKSKKSYL